MNEKKEATELFATFSGAIQQASVNRFIISLENFFRDQPRINLVHVGLATVGGEVNAGIVLFNYLKGHHLTIHTYNMGNVDSIGVVPFLAGTKRYMTQYSSFTLHGISLQAEKSFNKETLEEYLSIYKTLEKKIEAILVDNTTMQLDDIKKHHNQGASLGAEESQKYGLVHDIKIPPREKDSPHFFFGEVSG